MLSHAPLTAPLITRMQMLISAKDAQTGLAHIGRSADVGTQSDLSGAARQRPTRAEAGEQNGV